MNASGLTRSGDLSAPAAAQNDRTLPRRPHWPGGLWLLLLPALLLFVPVYLVPVGRLLLTSFGTSAWTLGNYREALGNPDLTRILFRTLLLSGEVTLLTLLLGYPIAYMIVKAPTRTQKWLLMLLAMPLWTSALVRSFAWVVLLGREGIINQLAMAIGLERQPTQLLYDRLAVLIGFVHVMLPYAVFPLVSLMKRIPPRLSATGMSLGASRAAAFWLIFFPLSLPGVVSAAVLTFVLTMGYFVTPALLGGLGDITYVMFIQQQVDSGTDWPLAAAMSVILLAVTLAVVVLFYRFLRAADDGERPRNAPSRPGRLLVLATTALGRLNAAMLRRPGAATPSMAQAGRSVRIVSWGVILFILLPILILVPLGLDGAAYLQFPPSSLSFRWYINYFSRSDWISATIVSFEVALPVMLLATALGTAAAVAANRLRNRIVTTLRGVLISPMIIPHILISIAMYFQFARLHLIGSLPGLMLAHCVIALPVIIILIEGALRRANPGPERAALSLGAGPIRAFLSTTLAAIRPSILTAALFAFLTSFDDVVIALFLSGTNATLPKRMWDAVNLEIDPTIAAASTMLVLLSICVVLAVELIALRPRNAPNG